MAQPLLREIEQKLKREITLSAVHVTLYRLEDKGYVKSKVGGATKKRAEAEAYFFHYQCRPSHAKGDERNASVLVEYGSPTEDKLTMKGKDVNPFPRASRFLRAFCPPDLLEEIEGDLIQKFEGDAKRLGVTKAKRRYLWNAIRFLRPGIVLRNKLNMNISSPAIFRNYLLIAVRQMRRDKIFSAISVFGLSISMATCFLIFQYAFYELNYDRQPEDADDLYRITTITYTDNQLRYPSALSNQDVAPEVERQTFRKWSRRQGCSLREIGLIAHWLTTTVRIPLSLTSITFTMQIHHFLPCLVSLF